jgi:5'-3' exonuclease
MTDEKENNRPILVIDGLNSFIRNFIANPTMTENGESAGGFVGFVRSLGLLCDKFMPSKIIVVWESGGNQKRRSLSGGTYKNNRRPASLNRYYKDDIPDTQENHNRQIALTIEALKCLPVCQIYVKDTEADDIISYICEYKFKESNIIVVSSDKDLYQLISPRVKQWSLNQKKLIDEKEVIEKLGVSPVNFCSVRAFIGDQSDNIEGVKGAGFKTMSKLFPEISQNEFISVVDIVKKAKTLSETKNNKVLTSIIEGENEAFKNWKLMHLDVSRMNGDQVKRVEYQLGTMIPEGNKISLLRILVREGLKTVDINSTYSSIKAACKQ